MAEDNRTLSHFGGTAPSDPSNWRGLPPSNMLESVALENRFQAMDNFQRTFAIRPGDRMVMLMDRLIDPRVIHALTGLARAKGVETTAIVSHTSQHATLPEEVKPILEKATFVVSTWYCSITDPFCMKLRSEAGQRWVKITYFRNLDVLDTPHARFPIDLIGEIIRATATRYPVGKDFTLKFSDPRDSDFNVAFTDESRRALLSSNRWRGVMTADEPGCYLHYVATHGPNLFEPQSADDPTLADANGVVYPQWAIGFPRPFADKIAVEFRAGRVTSVEGRSEEAAILRDMLIGGFLSELGCGFNPKAPRFNAYPAGSNSPGALHFGIDFPRPSNYIRKTMPNWEEPPVHIDLVSYDMTVTAGKAPLIDRGFLTSLRDPAVVAAAQQFGDPIDLLENHPD